MKYKKGDAFALIKSYGVLQSGDVVFITATLDDRYMVQREDGIDYIISEKTLDELIIKTEENKENYSLTY